MSIPANERPRRTVHSFVLREGRLTVGQARALQNLWPSYGIDAVGAKLDLPAVFGREAPCHLEIGCGNGEALLAMAWAHPENNHLGIEVHRPGLGSLLMQARRAGVRNLRLLRADAAEAVATLLPVSAFDGVYVFFPDPWPKKRHHKRRLLQPPFADALIGLLRDQGRLFIATDSDDYSRRIVTVMSEIAGVINLGGAARWSPRPAWRPVTRYELRARRLGHAIRELAYARGSA